MELFLAYAAAAACMAAGAFSWKLILKHQNYLQGLCLGMSLTRFRLRREDPDDFFSWRAYTCDGQYQGRQIRLDYRFRLLRETPATSRFRFQWKQAEELTVQIPVIQKFWLRLLPKRIPAGPDEEVQIGVPDFDETYLIHSNQPDAARAFLGSRLVQEHIRRLPAMLDRVEFHRGFLRMHIAAPANANFRRSDLENAFEALLLLATEYMQQSRNYQVRLLAAKAILCPYCRCPLQANEQTLNCGFCETRLHASCWQENGQCTTWGCASAISPP